MKKKIFLLIIIEIIMYSCFVINISYADDFDFVLPEVAGNVEPVSVPDTPADAGGGGYTPPDDPTITVPTEEKKSFSIDVPVAIQGIVFEDIDREEVLKEEGLAGTMYVTNNFKYDDGEPRIEGIKVEDAVTNANGEYSIKGEGAHNISFTYGEGISLDNYKLNKNTLKYNAQDYNMVVLGGGTTGFDKNGIRRIKEVEKSFTEVYIVLDHSTSMRTKKGTERLRIDVVKESAINFVDAIFKEAEGNLAVGYIAFAYEAVIVKKPTDIEEDVIDAIQNFKVEDAIGMYSGETAPMFNTLNHQVGSNIGGAVIKAKNNYLSEKSNKVMVLFSDGAATAHEGCESIYSSDLLNPEKVAKKLDDIATKTKEDLNSVTESEITLINILNKTSGTERKYVNKSFEGCANRYEVDYLNEEAVTQTLLKDTMEIIESTESEFTGYKDEKSFKGNDDAARRKEVNEYYNDIYYDKLKLFEAIDKLNGTKSNDTRVIAELMDSDKEQSQTEGVYQKFIAEGMENSKSDLGKFLENSWMKTESTTVTLYSVSRDASGRPTSAMGHTFEYYTKDGVEMCKVDGEEGYEAANVTVNEIPLTYNAALIRRDEFKLSLDKIVTGVRLTLSDGHVLYNMLSSNASETVAKNKEFKELYCKNLQKDNHLIDDFEMNIKKLDIEEVENIPNSVFLISDSDLLQGATIEVEYTFIIKNNSRNATFSKGFSLVDYYDRGLIYRADNKLLTEEGKNSDYKWQVLETDDMNSKLKYISDNVINKGNAPKQSLYIDFNKDAYEKEENIPEDGKTENFETKSKYVNPVIGNNGERYVKVVLSRVLSPDIINEAYFKNQAEIIKYRNNNGRRANYLEKESGKVVSKCPISGNYVPTDIFVSLPDSITHVNEIDTATSNNVGIIPPTGRTYKDLYYMILAEVLIASVGYITIRKIIRKEK